MRALKQFIAIALLPLFLAACDSDGGVKATSEVRPGVDFAAFKTFSWMSDQPLLMSPDAAAQVGPMLSGRLQSAIISVMATKGVQFVQNQAQADLVVGMTVGARDKIDVRSYPTASYGRYYGRYGMGGYGYYGYGASTTTTVRNYIEATLAIDFFDRKSGTPIFHARGTKRYYGSGSGMTQEERHAAVGVILRDYPSILSPTSSN